jgi:hypothetical protein
LRRLLVTRIEEDAVALLEHPSSLPLDRADWGPSALRRVVVRLVDGDVVQVGTAPNRDGALALARSVISEIESPTGEWPLVGNRLLRPEAVVSVDVLRVG